MKIRAIIALSLLCSVGAAPLLEAKISKSSHQNVSIPEGPKIKVLLAKDVGSVLLEVKGGYRVIRKDTGSVLSQGSMGKRFVVHALQKGLRWGEEFPDVYQISVLPKDSKTSIYVNGIQYKGGVSVYHVHDNQITVVNEVLIEDFIKSTLALEFGSPLAKEAMAALAIAARTEAYSLVMSGRVTPRPWDTTVAESKYYGYAVTRHPNEADKAVEATRFMVMESTKDGKVAQHVSLSAIQAEEFAKKNWNAKTILQKSFPNTRLGITIGTDEVAVLK
ncbi:MAG: SpoIID/LytB domain-containing protein [Chlamydiales bacterium]